MGKIINKTKGINNMAKFNAQIISDAGYSVTWTLPPGVEASEEIIENILDELINEWGFPENSSETEMLDALEHILDVGILNATSEKVLKKVVEHLRHELVIEGYPTDIYQPKFKSVHQQHIVDFVERENNE